MVFTPMNRFDEPRSARVRLAGLLLALTASVTAHAKPPGPSTFCAKYPTAPVCTGGQPACTYCHSSPPARNAFGLAVESHLAAGAPRPLSDGDFQAALPAALSAAESADSDGDGASNFVEIQKGTLPAERSSVPQMTACGFGTNPSYAVCQYDAKYTYRKVLLDFCAGSPTFDDLDAFSKLSKDDQLARLDATLDACMATEFWRGKNGQLWQLAHRKVRPVGSLKGGPEDTGVVQLGDYYDDYALFTYSQIDDHDARDVLTANYFVVRSTSPKTTYTTSLLIPFQGVDVAHRAGNLTTAWALGYFTMFTALPRNAASQAYRGYLGLDIAKQEGLYPVANEPRDYDAKGVTQPLCTQCHATLDPLSYPFRNYNGLSGTNNDLLRYVPNRIETFFSAQAPTITQIPESGYIFGQKVNDLKSWASVAANSDAFAVATVGDYWRLLMGGPPTSDQNDEFVALWQRFKTTNGYSVKKMLHELIRTEAYGAP